MAAAGSAASLSVFDYSQVELLDSPLRRQFDTNHAFFLHLDDDRMLKIYRQRVGMPAPGADMGGWYDDFCPGAHFGQYVSALARFARATDSETTCAKVKRLVRGFAETVDSSGKFFVDLRYPGYTYDKLVCGLLDAHSYAGDGTALDVLAATTRAALPHMADRALTPEEMQQRPHKDETYTWDETYTFAENLFIAFERTGDRKYYDLGKRYLLDRGFFDPLAAGQNVLPGLHAYSHVNALSSGIQGFLKLGNAKYFRAVKNAVDMILKDQSYATGGWGPNETFVKPGKGELGDSLRTTHRHFESGCGAYAHFKLMRYLLALTRESRYGDSMERMLYNVVLGIKPILKDGSTFYYSDYHASARKSYIRIIPDAQYHWDKDDRWPCCSGTFPQVTADYGISSYLRAQDGIYVNLYVPSRVSWKPGATRCSILQEIPLDDRRRLDSRGWRTRLPPIRIPSRLHAFLAAFCQRRRDPTAVRPQHNRFPVRQSVPVRRAFGPSASQRFPIQPGPELYAVERRNLGLRPGRTLRLRERGLQPAPGVCEKRLRAVGRRRDPPPGSGGNRPHPGRL